VRGNEQYRDNRSVLTEHAVSSRIESRETATLETTSPIRPGAKGSSQALPGSEDFRPVLASPNCGMAAVLSRSRGQPECAGSSRTSPCQCCGGRKQNRPVTRSRPTLLRRANCLEGWHSAAGGLEPRDARQHAEAVGAVSAFAPLSQGSSLTACRWH
jgi:hypothetical protein